MWQCFNYSGAEQIMTYDSYVTTLSGYFEELVVNFNSKTLTTVLLHLKKKA